jgi:hypothetical protein
MLQIDDAIISFDIFEKTFLCDLSACRGECCVAGEAGAPLEEDEIAILENILPVVWNDLSDKAKEIIRQQGVSYIDEEGDFVTSIVNECECVFTYFDDKGICKCAIEKAYKEGKIDFYKPISCHLYPIRLEKYHDFTAVNYHKWSVCHTAWELGKKVGMPVYRFLKEPIIRRFGEEWYKQLEIAADMFRRDAMLASHFKK